MAKKHLISMDDLIGRAQGELIKAQTRARNLGVCEFIETVVDAFDMTLFLSQRIILKGIFSEELEDTVKRSLCGAVDGICTNPKCDVDHKFLTTEQALMDKWVLDESCNWRNPITLLGEINMVRALEGETKRKDFKWQNCTLQCGMRGTKSALVALMCVYQAFMLYTAKTPQKDLGIPSSSPIYITVIASTERQALGTIFYYVKSYILNSTYFKTLIDSGECVVTELEINFPTKNIIIASGHSKPTSIVGRTAIMVAFDELAMFSADDGHSSNAKDVYERVGRSIATFKHDGRRIALSSVKSQGDFMETLVERDWDRQMESCLVLDLTTFEMNPHLSKNDPSIRSDYVGDLVSAERDYENIRPGATGAFLNAIDIERAMEGNDPQANCTYADMPIQRKRGEIGGPSGSDAADTREMSGLSVKVHPAKTLYETFGHCDPARKHDSFGFACGHAEWSQEGIITVIDIVLEWIPRQLPGGDKASIDYVNVEEILSDIAKKRHMTELSFDIFNSESIIQRLYREGVMTRLMPFSASEQKAMYDCLRQRLQAGLIKIPNHPSLREEMENLQLKNGIKVDHPNKKDSKIPGKKTITKDVVDCVASVNWHIAKMERDFIRGQYNGAPPALPSSTRGGITSVGKMSALKNVTWGNR